MAFWNHWFGGAGNAAKCGAGYDAIKGLCREAGLDVVEEQSDRFAVRGKGPETVFVVASDDGEMAVFCLFSDAKLSALASPPALGFMLLGRNARSSLYAWRADQDGGEIALSLRSLVLTAGATATLVKLIVDGMCGEAVEVAAHLRRAEIA